MEHSSALLCRTLMCHFLSVEPSLTAASGASVAKTSASACRMQRPFDRADTDAPSTRKHSRPGVVSFRELYRFPQYCWSSRAGSPGGRALPGIGAPGTRKQSGRSWHGLPPAERAGQSVITGQLCDQQAVRTFGPCRRSLGASPSSPFATRNLSDRPLQPLSGSPRWTSARQGERSVSPITPSLSLRLRASGGETTTCPCQYEYGLTHGSFARTEQSTSRRLIAKYVCFYAAIDR